MSMTKNKHENQVTASRSNAGSRVAALRRFSKMEKDKSSSIPWRKYYEYGKNLIFDPNYVAPACYLILIGELVLNWLIVEYVPYTEIDWKAYMQEVESFLNSTLDYSLIRGDTGPCVYPAGFLYVYSAFYYITDHGSNIKLAQYIFIAIYLAQSYLTYNIVIKTCKLPAYALVLSCLTSYRIHSIYVLRLFNDPIAVLLFWAALNALVNNRWKLGSLLFSLAVSIKMNILLYAPCLLLAYIANLHWTSVIVNLGICGAVQIMLGLPFLMTYPWSYIKASFDLGRVFEHKWTVNYRFLDEEIFTDKRFHIALLVVHLSLLGVFAPYIWKYFKAYASLRKTICDMKQQSNEQQTAKKTEKKDKKSQKTSQTAPVKPPQAAKPSEAEEELTSQQQQFLDAFEKQIKADKPPKSKRKHNAHSRPRSQAQQDGGEDDQKYEINFSKISQLFVLPFFVTNLIGVACARSLHYQFYSWYFHSLLYLVFSTPFSKPFTLLLLGLLESSWNIYPSTERSSATLHIVHGVVLYGVYKTMRG